MRCLGRDVKLPTALGRMVSVILGVTPPMQWEEVGVDISVPRDFDFQVPLPW
jgi:hypothetical protein